MEDKGSDGRKAGTRMLWWGILIGAVGAPALLLMLLVLIAICVGFCTGLIEGMGK